MIWAAWALLTFGLWLVAMASKRERHADAALIILGGLLAMQMAKMVFPDAMFLAAALIWVTCGAAVLLISGGKFVAVALSLVASGACYFIGRFAGLEFGPNAALITADAFGAASLLIIGGGLAGDIARVVRSAFRGDRMGGGF